MPYCAALCCCCVLISLGAVVATHRQRSYCMYVHASMSHYVTLLVTSACFVGQLCTWATSSVRSLSPTPCLAFPRAWACAGCCCCVVVAHGFSVSTGQTFAPKTSRVASVPPTCVLLLVSSTTFQSQMWWRIMGNRARTQAHARTQVQARVQAQARVQVQAPPRSPTSPLSKPHSPMRWRGRMGPQAEVALAQRTQARRQAHAARSVHRLALP